MVPPHFTDNSQLDSGLSLTDNLIENLTNTLSLLTQSYKTYLPQTNNQLRTSSNPRNQATVQDGKVVVQNVLGRQNRGQGNNAWGAGTAGYGGALNRVRNVNPGEARQVKCYRASHLLEVIEDLKLISGRPPGVRLPPDILISGYGYEPGGIAEYPKDIPLVSHQTATV
ncbi:hypothetical protein Tco_0593565 [Tanacetum coccineum]